MRRTLFLLRVTWAMTLLACLSYVAVPVSLRVAYAEVAPRGIWCPSPVPWGEDLAGAALFVVSLVLPTAIHRRAIARLRRRAVLDVDPERPGDYRRRPARKAYLERPDPALRAAAGRYLGRLALSLALLAPLPLMAGPLMGQFPVACSAICTCLYEPARYGPLLLLAIVGVLARVPTRRRVFGPIADLVVTSAR